MDRRGWFENGAEQVADHVVRVPMPVSVDGLHAVNVYVLADPAGPDWGTDLIDAGDAAAVTPDRLHEALQGVGHSLDVVRRVLVTHVHPDHYTLAPGVRARTGATVHLGAGEQPNLEAMNRLRRGERVANASTDLERTGAEPLRERLDPRRMTGQQGPEVEGPDTWTTDGEVFDVGGGRLRVHATPGHTRGHVVFHDAGRALWFTGDHVLPHITPSIGYQSAPVRTSLGDYLASLRLVLAQPDGLLLPAHGPTGPSVHARAAELVEFHEERLRATRAAVADTGSSAYEVAGRLRWTRHDTAYADLEPWHALMAATETAAHLDVLVERGELARVDGAPDHYRAA